MKILTSLVRMANASEDREFVKCLADNPDYSRLSFEKAIHVIQRENLVSEHVIQDLRKLLQEVRNSKCFSNLNTKMRWCFDHRFQSFNGGYSTVISTRLIKSKDACHCPNLPAGSASLQMELVNSAELVAVSGSGPVFQDERFCRKLPRRVPSAD